jgi:hypothetical protein
VGEAVDAIRERAREAVRNTEGFQGRYGRDRYADAASDVWAPEVERLRDDSVPRSALVQVGWRHRTTGRVCSDCSLGDLSPHANSDPVYVVREQP